MNYTKKDFIETCRKNINREGIDELLEALEDSDFYTAPCSTKYHLNYEGGLLDHSFNVLNTLIDLTVYKDFNPESVFIVALFHDLCKIGEYVKNNKGEWVKTNYFPFGHGEKSVLFITKYMDLTDEEILAIRWHMGSYDASAKGDNGYLYEMARKQYPLVTALHLADMIATHLIEG